MATDEAEAVRAAAVQKRDHLFILMHKLEKPKPKWLSCFDTVFDDDDTHLVIEGYINQGRNMHTPCGWQIRSKPDYIIRMKWYYESTLNKNMQRVPQNKSAAVNEITGTRFFDPQSVLDALASFYEPLQSLTTLINIHERVKQLESLYQTRQARVP